MYEFATVVLLGVFVASLVSLIGHARPVSTATGITLAILAGLGIAWATDYSAFAGWGIRFRELWMGPVATGLVIAGLAAVWQEVLRLIGAYARRPESRTTEPESTVSRVA